MKLGQLGRFGAVIWGVLLLASTAHGQGVWISAAGPVNRGMGGASTAAPTSALGAVYWNPATISGLESSELEASLDLLFTNHSVSSTVAGFTGFTDAEPGVVPIPNVGWVYHVEDTPITLGLGVNLVAGLKTNLPTDPTNPVLAAPPVGLGRVTSEANFLQLAPILSWAVNEQLSFAVGPTATTGQVMVEPFVLDAANVDGRYASGRASRYHWGGGAQAGVYYIAEGGLHLGASVKTPTWMETFEFYSNDAAGGPRTLKAHLDLPMIISLGLAYSQVENWLFALDVRYFDYANTDGFGDPAVFDPATAALAGLDWSSVYAVSAGAQHRLTEKLYLRAGYTYNQSPIRNSEAFVNIASPLIYEHMFSVGASFEFSDKAALSLAYSHMLHTSRTGPVVLPGIGPVPGSSFTADLDTHFLSFGIVMRN